MKNIEIKAKCTDPLVLKELVISVGGKYIDQLVQTDTYFNTPHARLKLREITGKENYLIYYEELTYNLQNKVSITHITQIILRN